MPRHPWMTLCCAGLLVLTVAQASAAGDATPAARMDFVTHNEIVVNAAPDAIWPYVLRMNDWKKGARLVPIGGSPDKVGAKFKAVAGGDATAFYVENVELVSQQVRTLRLNELDGTLIGFASLRLTPHGRTTLVRYDVYVSMQEPPAVSAYPPEAQRTNEPGFIAQNRKRFDEELATLKGLAESRQR